jgi:hypothetical protein
MIRVRVQLATLDPLEQGSHVALDVTLTGAERQRPKRADALLGSLRGVIPYAAAWIGVRDPERRTHRRVGWDGDTDSLARYFALPEADDELEEMG